MEINEILNRFDESIDSVIKNEYDILKACC